MLSSILGADRKAEDCYKRQSLALMEARFERHMVKAHPSVSGAARTAQHPCVARPQPRIEARAALCSSICTPAYELHMPALSSFCCLESVQLN